MLCYRLRVVTSYILLSLIAMQVKENSLKKQTSFFFIHNMYIYTEAGENSRHNANRAMAGGYSDFGSNRL